MAQIDTPFLIPLGAAGMVAHRNRWLAKPGELLLAENVTVENDLLQKEPSAAYYDPAGMSGLLVLDGNATVGATLVLLDAFPASASAAKLATTLNQGIAAAGASWVIPFTATGAVGVFQAVGITREAGTGGAATVTDTKGNTYTKVHTATGSGMQAELWVSILTTAIALTDSLTIVASDPTANLNVVAATYSGVTSITPQSQTFVAVGAGIFTTPFINSTVFPVLLIGVVCNANPATVITFTNATIAVGPTAITAHITTEAYRVDQGQPGILAQVEWDSSATNAPPGLVTITEGSTRVDGNGACTFLTSYRPGDEIMVAGETQRVDTITSNLILTVIDKWAHTVAVVAHTRRAGPVLITAVVGRTGGGFPLVGGLNKERPANGAATNRGTLNQVTLISTLNPAPSSAKFVIGGKEIAANNRKLFFFNGVDVPVVAMSGDGNIAVAMANPAADWGAVADPQKQPINGIVHQDSLMAFGNWNDPHRLYISSTTDHEDFRTAPTGTAITMRIGSQVGIRLYGAATYQGVLFLFKYPNGVFYLDDTAVDRFQWSYRIRSASVGCAPSPHAVLSIDDDVIFCDPNGHFHLLSAVNTLGGTRDSDLTRTLGLQDWTQQHVDTNALDQIVSIYDPQTKIAWFGLRSQEGKASGLVQNDLIIRWDFSQQNPRMTTARAWQPQSLAVKRRNWTGQHAVIIGETTNCWFVRPGDYGTRTDRDYANAVDLPHGIASRIDLPEMDFDEEHARLRHIRKRFTNLEVVAEAEHFTQPLTIELRLDGVLRQTLRIEEPNVRRIMKVLTCGDGYTIEARCTTDGTEAGDVPLIGLIFYHAPTSTGHSRKS